MAQSIKDLVNVWANAEALTLEAESGDVHMPQYKQVMPYERRNR